METSTQGMIGIVLDNFVRHAWVGPFDPRSVTAGGVCLQGPHVIEVDAPDLVGNVSIRMEPA